MKIPLADLKLQHSSIKKELDLAINKVIDNCSFIMSKDVTDFEQAYAKFCNAKFCVGTSNGTNAIALALEACNIKEGDEVITVPNTFIATTEAISQVGATIKFVDIEEKTYLMDPEKIESVITKNTKAIIPVHLNGLMCDMKKIKEIANKHNLIVIEDSSQAHGALFENNPPGYYSDAATFSFFPGKNLGAFGDAGAIITNNPEIAKKAGMQRNHGREPNEKYKHKIEGYNERLDSLQAAILNIKLKYLNDWNNKRIKNANIYYQKLNKKRILPYVPSKRKHVYHQFVLRVKNRDELINYLKEKDINTSVNYPLPLHLQPAYQKLGLKEGDFPITEKVSKEIVSIPILSAKAMLTSGR